MRSIEDKSCYNHGPTQEISSSSAISFEFHKGNGANRSSSHHRTALGKPTPSKWDDAQKWLVGLSRGGGGGEKNQSKPRNSNADDRRLIAPVAQKDQDYFSSDYNAGEEERNGQCIDAMATHYDVETKNVDCDESVWRVNKAAEKSNSTSAIRSICVRDMGTEMTPIASQEPSRTATPIRATTPAARSPITSGSSTPVRCQHGLQGNESYQTGLPSTESRGEVGVAGRGSGGTRRYGDESNACKIAENNDSDQARKLNTLESRAIAWDEAERAKYMARYKREEVKIQAWENHQKRKAEMEMKKMEVKAERLKARAQERLTNKLAATRRIAEEKRTNAEAELNEKAVRTSERADYIRRTGHLPTSFSIKLPSLCW
ncbi:hypothetical protein Dsin_010611 [Dipteronia sinensis]|uniref:Remorin C-terminal domain-containing protein n=1 Tax=Dipteronia sinensis TaxID=43782 RepID=A0AAE0ASU0_9ROSI|nr:hypothetical protein Dsin_010611 [Dipteronia sinensis]